MAKKVYIGESNLARKVSEIYLGIDGKARKVVKGYIGVNGVARQFWPELILYYWNKYNTVKTYLYYWDRYNLNSTTRYYWDRYNVTEITRYRWNMLELITETGVQKDIGNITIERTRDSICYLINSINSTNDSGFILNGDIKPFNELNNNDVFSFEANDPRIAYRVTDSPSRVPGSSLNYEIKADQYSFQIINYSGSFISIVESSNRSDYPTNAPQDGYWYQYLDSKTNYYKGSYIDQINSTDKSDYPDDGRQDDYWYIYDRSDTTYSQGSYIGQVASTNRSQYPDNSYSGSYWYVYNRVDTSYSQGSYIGVVQSENPSAYPSNGRHADGYWYVKQ